MFRNFIILTGIFFFFTVSFSQQLPSETSEKDTGTDSTVSQQNSQILATNKTATVSIPKFDVAPEIDGDLNDPVWEQAAVFTDFLQIQPGDNTQTAHLTIVKAGYDKKNIYLGFYVYDDSSQIRATIAKRDAIFDDDNIGVYLDTYNDKRRAYALFFNPLGIQADSIYTEGKGQDFTVDIVMVSKGKVVADGYVVEVAIPFKSLNYSTGENKLWGINFYRETKRLNNEIDSWVPISRDKSGTLSQFGSMGGLDSLREGRTLDIIPSIIASETGRRALTFGGPIDGNDPGRFLNQPFKFEPGITVKYKVNSSTSLDFTYNPDFAQVEADQTVVTANRRFPIFYPEKRPFFLENIDTFTTPLNPLNTRAIIDPLVAAKLSGKAGRNSYGFLFALDSAPGNFTEDERNDPGTRPFIERFIDKDAFVGVMRYKRDIGKENSLGIISTIYSFPNERNNVTGFDGRFRLNSTTFFSFQTLGTFSKRCFEFNLGQIDCSNRNGFGYYFELDKSARNWTFNFSGSGRTRNYIADVGFTPRVNTNRQVFLAAYNSTPKNDSKLISWRISNSAVVNYDWRGRSQNNSDEIQLSLNFPSQTFAGIGTNYGYERLFQEEFGSPFARNTPERSAYYNNVFGYIGSTPYKQVTFFLFLGYASGVFDFDFGAGPKFPRVSPAALNNPFAPRDPGPGKSFNASLNVTYRPTQKLRMSFDFTKSRLRRNDTDLIAFDDNIFSTNITYQLSRFWSVRARTDYETLFSNVRGQYLIAWEPKPGTAVFMGYNNDLSYNGQNPFTFIPEKGFQRNGQTFFVKFSYLFRKTF